MTQLDRRKFLKKSVKGTMGLLTLTVIPFSLTACNKDDIDTNALANLGPLEELKKGPFPKKVNYSTKIKDAWVEQEREGFVYINIDSSTKELLVMSPICTHLGCTATQADNNLKNEGISLFCPCHGGKYDEFGINIGGPPPRPLDIFEPIIQDGNVYIPILSAKERP